METVINKLLGETSWMTNLEFLLRILLASMLGAVVGIERSRRQKDAGIRTHSVVACATAAFMIISKYGFSDLDLAMVGVTIDGIRGADPARIAAQVVTGLGFLGAGVIFKTGNSIKGLTTAAGLWTTAAIGMAVGSGMYLVGIFTALMLVIVQMATHKYADDEGVVYTSRITVTAKRLLDLSWIKDQLDPEARVREGRVLHNEDDTVTYNFTIKADKEQNIEEQLEPMYHQEDIISIYVSKSDTK